MFRLADVHVYNDDLDISVIICRLKATETLSRAIEITYTGI